MEPWLRHASPNPMASILFNDNDILDPIQKQGISDALSKKKNSEVELDLE